MLSCGVGHFSGLFNNVSSSGISSGGVSGLVGLSSGVSTSSVGCLSGVSSGHSFGFEGLFGVVYDLSFNWDVLVSDLFLGDLDVLSPFFRDVLRDVLSEVFYGIVVSDGDFFGDVLNLSLLSVFSLLHLLGHSFHSCLVFIFNDLLLEGNVFNSALSLNHFLSVVHSCSHNVAHCVLSSLGSVVGSGGGNVAGGSGGDRGSTDCVLGSGGGVVVGSDGFSGLAVNKLA